MRRIRGRKDHRCDMCDRTIPQGDEHLTWTLKPWQWDGDSWFTGRAHITCDEAFSEWMKAVAYPSDEALLDPTDFRHWVLREDCPYPDGDDGRCIDCRSELVAALDGDR